MRILLAEDEKEIASFVLKGLKAERFAVDWTPKGEQALMWAKVNDYDLAIIDVKLADNKNGLDICRMVRQKGKTFPIIVLSVIHDTAIKINALNHGADDYLTKPFAFAELLARMRALLRREKQVIGPIIKVADLELDATAHSVRRRRQSIRLNRKEFALLEYLMKNQGATMSRTDILKHVWETTADALTNTVDVHIRFLRKKIDSGHAKKLIHTIHGRGYKLEEQKTKSAGQKSAGIPTASPSDPPSAPLARKEKERRNNN